MKTLFTLLLCLCATLAHAQVLDSLKFPIDPDTHLITYTEVVSAQGIPQTELYARAKLWFAGTFKSAKDVVQADEKEAGVVQGAGWQTIYIKSMGIPSPLKLWYTVKLAVKDGRYKYDISSFRTEAEVSKYNLNPTANPVEGTLLMEKTPGVFRGIYRQERRQLNDAAVALVSSIKAGMSKPAAGTTGGKDW